MNRRVYFSLLVSFTWCITLWILASGESEGQPSTTNQFYKIDGASTNGMQPSVVIEKPFDDWVIDLEFVAQTNFPENAWLKTTNRLGSRLRLWRGDGSEVLSGSKAVLSALSIPTQSTVSNILAGAPTRLSRLRLWLPLGPQWGGHDVGRRVPSAQFSLRDAFDVTFTNNFVLQITPLLYRVDEKVENAQLLQFPPIRIELLSNGVAQKLDTPSTPSANK